MSQHPHDTVLVTGASSGIGRELAKRFAADGSALILVARREEKLRELAEELAVSHGAVSLVLAVDLSNPDGPRQLYEAVQSAGKAVDVLVNNAGFGQFGRFHEIPLERQLAMVQLNVAAVVDLTYRFLPQMLARRRGAILNLGSTASFQPGPNVAVYYATKAFVLSFSEALWQELRGTGVAVTCLCPGPTRTEFGDESGMHDTPVFKYNSMEVAAVADAGYKALRRDRRLVIPGLVNKLLAFSVRISPRRTVLQVMSRLQPYANRKPAKSE